MQFSILLQPRADISLFRIDRIIFRIPNEFNYGTVKTLDSCTMIGKVATTVSLCALTRVQGYTYVTFTVAATYDNTPKMVTIADSTAANLFITPALPGDHYNMTADLYSGTTLVER